MKKHLWILSLLACFFSFASMAYAEPTNKTYPLYAGNPDAKKTVIVYWNPASDKAKELFPVIKEIAATIKDDERLIIVGGGNEASQDILMHAASYIHSKHEKKMAWKYLEDLTNAGQEPLEQPDTWLKKWGEKNPTVLKTVMGGKEYTVKFIGGVRKHKRYSMRSMSAIDRIYSPRISQGSGKVLKKGNINDDAPVIGINFSVRLNKKTISVSAVREALEKTRPNGQLPTF